VVIAKQFVVEITAKVRRVLKPYFEKAPMLSLPRTIVPPTPTHADTARGATRHCLLSAARRAHFPK
jgi:hypothetical protein